MKPQSADFISKKASFPPQSRKEAHRRGTTLTYTSGSIKKDEIKKSLVPSDKGADCAVPPCIILHILNADKRRTYSLQPEAPRGHARLPYRFPPSRLSVTSSQAQSCSSPLLFYRYYNRPRPSCQEWGGKGNRAAPKRKDLKETLAKFLV